MFHPRTFRNTYQFPQSAPVDYFISSATISVVASNKRNKYFFFTQNLTLPYAPHKKNECYDCVVVAFPHDLKYIKK